MIMLVRGSESESGTVKVGEMRRGGGVQRKQKDPWYSATRTAVSPGVEFYSM
jgi:hypothetical protein